MRVRRLVALGFCAVLLWVSRAEATVIYSTMADSEFHIAASGVALGMPFDGSFFVTGNGVAGYSGVATTGTLPAKLHVEVFGSAFAPPASYATSTFMSGHIITIDNQGVEGLDTMTISVPFKFIYSWVVSLSRDDPMTEFAAAGAFFAISGIDNESLFVDGMGFVPGYLHHIMETTALGGTGSSGSVVITGHIVVPAETLSEFSVITDSTGFAVATVPEPGSWLLLCLGAIGLVRPRRAIRRLKAVARR